MDPSNTPWTRPKPSSTPPRPPPNTPQTLPNAPQPFSRPIDPNPPTFAISGGHTLSFPLQGPVVLLPWLGGLEGLCGFGLLLLLGGWGGAKMGCLGGLSTPPIGGKSTPRRKTGSSLTRRGVFRDGRLHPLDAEPVSCEQGDKNEMRKTPPPPKPKITTPPQKPPPPLRQTSRGTRGSGVLMISLKSTSFSS